MIYHNEAAILCPQPAAAIGAFSRTFSRAGVGPGCGFYAAPRQPFEGPYRVRHSLSYGAPALNRPWNLSVLETQDAFGTLSAGFERLRISDAASEAEEDAAMGCRLEIVDCPADHRPTKWERHDAR